MGPEHDCPVLIPFCIYQLARYSHQFGFSQLLTALAPLSLLATGLQYLTLNTVGLLNHLAQMGQPPLLNRRSLGPDGSAYVDPFWKRGFAKAQ